MHHLGTSVDNIGKNNLIHIEPINKPILDRPYVRQMKRCSDCLLRMREIENILQ